MAAHTHRPAIDRVVPYRGTARGAVSENGRAHGGICIIEQCSCGATRETNRNGNYIEQGAWCRDDDERPTRRPVSLTAREIATILYALRQVQRSPISPCGEHFTEVDPLTHDEIDTLCEQINLRRR